MKPRTALDDLPEMQPGELCLGNEHIEEINQIELDKEAAQPNRRTVYGRA